MGILSWLIMGLIGGVLAKFIMPGDDPGGIIVTIALGIAGAFRRVFTTIRQLDQLTVSIVERQLQITLRVLEIKAGRM